MTDYRELNELAKNPPRARHAASFLLAIDGIERTDWEIDFLTNISTRDAELTTRQAESLLDIRNNSVRYTVVSGYNLLKLVDRCWALRQELADEDDAAWLVELKTRSCRTLTRPEAFRLRRSAIELECLERHVYWHFPVPAALRI